MITRLYVNNYRCLVAFETEFDSFGVLCGPNGSGKSSVFDAIRVIRDLATSETTIESIIDHSDRTNWLTSNVMEFEIDIHTKGLKFTYGIHIEQVAETLKPRIIKEWAICDGKHLFNRDLDGVKIERSSGTVTAFPLDWRQAALGAIQPTQDRKEIEVLQQSMENILILRPNPVQMDSESKEESIRPDVQFQQLISWYRTLSQEQDWLDHFRDSLQSVWPDFSSFRLINTGLTSKSLQLKFEGNGSSEVGSLFFGQLSFGEKMLVGLYMVESALATGAAQTLLIDEPDNFLGLPEIQPWVLSMMELCGDESQAIIISHHPEILNMTNEETGRYIWRENHSSPTRILDIKAAEGLTISETIARGWIHA